MKKLAIIIIFLGASTSAALADSTLSQGYLSDKPVESGALVSLTKNPEIVQAADTNNVESLVGVIVPLQKTLLALTSGGNQVQVATSGIVETLLCTCDGDLKVGDKVTASPLSGVGTRAVQSTRVIGVAQGSLDAKSQGAVKTSVKDKGGKTRDVYLGKVPVQLGVTYYSTGVTEKNPVPSFVQKFANAVAAKQVQPLPIYVSLAIMLITLLAAGIILYASIRSAIVSVGRNPLAKAGVIRSLIQVTILTTLLLIAGLITIYFVLRLA